MLRATNISRIYQKGKTGFRNLSFSIKDSEIIGIIGTSGCGKSTLLRVLSGLDQHYQGKIEFQKASSERPIGMMFQEPRLMPWLTVRDNIYFGLHSKDEKKELEELLKLVGLTGFEYHFPKDLSGGMAQRTAIARALITQPELLLLDEPFSALDAFTKMQLQDLLLSIWEKRRTTMILVTHDIDEALYLCDRILILRGQPGEIYAEVSIDQQRPRDRSDKDLTEKKAEILKHLDLSHAI